MPIPAAPPENLPGVEARGEEDEEKKRADAEVRQLPDHVLRDKMLREENAIKGGLPSRLRDGGKRLRASIESIHRELSLFSWLCAGTEPHAYVSRQVTLCSVLKAIKGSEAIFRSVGSVVPDRFAVEVYAVAPWHGIPENVRRFKAMSSQCDSVEEAEESAANNLVAILQKEYGVVVDDFNYAALCMEREKKA